jgi:large subunit ribosomal protein LX
MADQKFEVNGEFNIGNEWKPYTKVINAPNENQAIERIYTLIGSKHRLKRNFIRINSITLISGE